MKEPRWQLGKIRTSLTFPHMIGQCVWLRAEKPILETCVTFAGERIRNSYYTSQLLDWHAPPYQLTFFSSSIELLPKFLIDEDPPLIPFEEWSHPDYVAYREEGR